MGLKLGDSIIQINEQDTTDMALQDAQTLIEISTNQQLKLKVQKLVPKLSIMISVLILITINLQRR